MWLTKDKSVLPREYWNSTSYGNRTLGIPGSQEMVVWWPEIWQIFHGETMFSTLRIWMKRYESITNRCRWFQGITVLLEKSLWEKPSFLCILYLLYHYTISMRINCEWESSQFHCGSEKRHHPSTSVPSHVNQILGCISSVRVNSNLDLPSK